jgi:hypothetical protein
MIRGAPDTELSDVRWRDELDYVIERSLVAVLRAFEQ